MTQEQLDRARIAFSKQVLDDMQRLDISVRDMATLSELSTNQIQKVRSGKVNYNIDSYLRVRHVLDAAMKKRRSRA